MAEPLRQALETNPASGWGRELQHSHIHLNLCITTTTEYSILGCLRILKGCHRVSFFSGVILCRMFCLAGWKKAAMAAPCLVPYARL